MNMVSLLFSLLPLEFLVAACVLGGLGVDGVGGLIQIDWRRMHSRSQ